MDTVGAAKELSGSKSDMPLLGVLKRSGLLMLVNLVFFLASFLLIAFAIPDDFNIQTIRANPDRVATSQALAPYRSVWVAADLLSFLTFASTTLGFWLLASFLIAQKGSQSAKAGRIILVLALCIWLLVTYLRVALDAINITSPAGVPPLVSIVGLDITAQRIMLLIFSLGVALMSWSVFQSGLLRRIGLVSTLLSGLTFVGGLVLLILGQGFPPIVVLLCTYAIGIGLLRYKEQTA